MRNRGLMTAAALGALGSVGLCGGGACAAPTPHVSATARNTAPSIVSELLVVAEKREENVEAVPIAITAFSAEKREIVGISNLQNLSDFAPGLSYVSQLDQVYIRGVGRNTINLAVSSGVATYYNGVYYSNHSVLIGDSLFIANVEVDNGPQNALHGSNADGGLINYVSPKPTSDFYAEGRVGVASYGYGYAEAIVSGPINDHVRLRLGGDFSDQTGGFRNNLIGRPEGGYGPLGDNGRWGYVEGQVSANFDGLDIWALASSGAYHLIGANASVIGNFPTEEFGETSSVSPSSYFGLCGLRGANAAQCSLGPDSVVPGSVTGARVLANQFPGDNPANVNPHHFIDTTPDATTLNGNLGLQTVWTYHLRAFDLQYTGGFQTYRSDAHFNQTPDSGITSYQLQGPPGLGNLTIYPSEEFSDFAQAEHYFSNEVDLISSGGRAFQWIVGGYQFHDHFDQPISDLCFPNQPQLRRPLEITLAPASADPNGCGYIQDGDIAYDDYAGYAHGSYDLSSQWQLAGGARYTTDHKYGSEAQRVVSLDLIAPFDAATLGASTPAIDISEFATLPEIFAPLPGVAAAVFNPATGFVTRRLRGAWSAATGDATIAYQPDNQTLAYFRYARGYKAGGLDAGALSPQPVTQSESVDDFEVGFKRTWGLAFLLNLAGFYENWANDQQALAIRQEPTGDIVTEPFNIPQSRIYGVESHAEWRPIEPWTLSLTYGYLNARITNMDGECAQDGLDPQGQLSSPSHLVGCSGSTQNLVGNTLPYATPNKVALDSQYTMKLAPGDLTLSASLVWKAATYGSIFDEPQSLAPAYTTVNLRAYFADAKDRFTVIAYVSNVFDSLAVDGSALFNASANNNVLVPITGRFLVAPRTFGLEFQYRFK